jgi:putative phosphoesterase
VVVLADTHLRTAPVGGRRRSRSLPEAVRAALPGAAAILHAGDLLDAGVLGSLAGYAPVHAVLGNNDVWLAGRLPHTLVVELADVRVGMIHDSGPSRGRAARLRRRFPDAGVVVFGHSHAPVAEEGEGGQLLFNPGSPTQRRAQPVCTFGELYLAEGAVIEHCIIPVGGSG